MVLVEVVSVGFRPGTVEAVDLWTRRMYQVTHAIDLIDPNDVRFGSGSCVMIRTETPGVQEVKSIIEYYMGI